MKVLEGKIYRCVSGFDSFYEKGFLYDIANEGDHFYSLNEYREIVVFTKEFMEEHFQKVPTWEDL